MLPAALVVKLVEETENEIRIRLRNPGDFQSDSFRQVPMKRDKPRVFGIIGRLKGESKTTLQSLRFPKGDGWTKSTASKWARDHDFMKSLGIGNIKEFLKDWDDAVDDEELLDTFQAEGWLEDPEKFKDTDDELALMLADLNQPIIRREWVPPVEIKRVNEETGEVDIIASSDRLDLDREVMEPDGMQIDMKGRLPLVSSHSYNILNQIGDIPEIKPRAKRIDATVRYFFNMGNPVADWGFVLAKMGVARYSIGFMPLEWEDANLDDEKEFQAVRERKKPRRRYTKWSLLEISHVVIPSNVDAVQRLIVAGVLQKEFAEHFKTRDEVTSPEAMGVLEKALELWAELRVKQTTKVEKAIEPVEVVDNQEDKHELDDDLLKMFEEAALKLPEAIVEDKKRVTEPIVKVSLDTEAFAKTLEDARQAILKDVTSLLEGKQAEIESRVEEITKQVVKEIFGPDSAAHASYKDLIAVVFAGVRDVVDKEIAEARGSVDPHLLEMRK